jgi:hypothetical protein
MTGITPGRRAASPQMPYLMALQTLGAWFGSAMGRPFSVKRGQVRLPSPIARRCPALMPASRPMVEAGAFACRGPLLAGHAGACQEANGAAARRLDISRHTASTHLRHVIAKLGIPDWVALAAVAHHSIK